jgi:hypothetical protein
MVPQEPHTASEAEAPQFNVAKAVSDQTPPEGASEAKASQLYISPTFMDPATQQKGKELQKVMRLFRQATTTPPPNLTVCCRHSSTNRAKQGREQNQEQGRSVRGRESEAEPKDQWKE